MIKLQPPLLVTTSALALLLAGGCTQKNTFVEPPPPEVTVASPLKQTVTNFLEIPGRTQAKESAEIRARVNGYLESVDFVDGEMVEQGQQLFVIEPEPFEAALKAAEADLAQAQANRGIRQTEYDRRKQAYESRAISIIDLERAKAELDKAQAEVLAKEAAVVQAQLNLSYTTNQAPFAGIIDRKLVSAGNLVGGATPTLLTTLVAQDPIYVYFNISERRLVPHLQKISKTEDLVEIFPPVQLKLADDSLYKIDDEIVEGRIDFLDNKVDPETGTINARAVFDNKKGGLKPGLYGKVLVPDVRTNATLVPDLSIQRDIGGTYVLVVDAEGKVASQYVELGPKVEKGRIIEHGLEGDERVIVGGIQRARPGIKVNAREQGTQTEVSGEVKEPSE